MGRDEVVFCGRIKSDTVTAVSDAWIGKRAINCSMKVNLVAALLVVPHSTG